MKLPIDGLDVSSEVSELAEVQRVKVTNESGAARLGEPIGETVNIKSRYFRIADIDAHKELSEVVAEQISSFITADTNSLTLVVGLGNPNIPADSLGSRVLKKILTTSHMSEFLNEQADEMISPVATFLPGVMADTGLSSAELVKGVCDRIKPTLVIIVDAFVASSIETLNNLIYVTNSGVTPGIALKECGKHPLNADFLGVPIIIIGAPLVINVVALARDAVGLSLPSISNEDDKIGDVFNKPIRRVNEKKSRSARQVLYDDYDLDFVAPASSGDTINFFADIIAGGINLALHKGVTTEQLQRSIN